MTTARAEENRSPAAASAGPWSALRYRTFRYLWIATVVSNIGAWMYDAASGWLMTSLNANALVVSLVQVANSLPLFLFALPAGALADMIDKRRFILVLEILTTLFSATFAALLTWHAVTPTVLLLFVFLLGSLAAIETPAWQSIVPQLVPAPALSSAVATNSVGVNVSRVLGPALAGFLILALGIAAPFWVDAFSNLGVIAVLLWWRSDTGPAYALPPEHLGGAIRAGWRYARNNRHLRATLARAVGFFLFASAYWALLPLVARAQLRGGPTLYGVLLGAIGAGAVGGAFFLPRLKARSGANALVAIGQAGTALALLLFALASSAVLGVLACLIAGVSWILVLATLNVSAQVALPEWVRGRGLAAYVAVFFGTMSVGSLIWGYLGARAGLPAAHLVAAAGALLAILLTWRWKLQTGPQADLTPSMHWPEPVRVAAGQDDTGPVLVTIQYEVTGGQRSAFLAGMAKVGHERRRDGAYDWGIFEDTAHPDRILETFYVDSWLEHLRQHRRVTKADQRVEDELSKLLRVPMKITHYLAARTTRPEISDR